MIGRIQFDRCAQGDVEDGGDRDASDQGFPYEEGLFTASIT